MAHEEKYAEPGKFDEGPPGEWEEGYEEEEDPEFAARYDDAMEMNRKLKSMLAAAAAGEIDLPPEMLAMLGQSAGMGPPPRGGGDPLGPLVRSTAPAGAMSSKRRAAKKKIKPSGRVGAAPMPKSNYTFSEDRLVSIGKGNNMLMDRLTEINSGKGVMRTRGATDRRAVKRSSASINRKKKAYSIVNENAKFLQRLQNVKATSSFSRSTLKKDAARQNKLRKMRRTIDKPRSAGTKRATRKPKRRAEVLPDMVF